MNIQAYVIAIDFFVMMAAAVIQTSLGIGFSMIASPILTLFIPMKTCMAAVSIAAVIVGSYIVLSLRKHLNWKLAIPAAIGLTSGRVLGVQLLMLLGNGALLKHAFGVLLVLFSGYFFFSRKHGGLKIRGTAFMGAALGFAAGILGGLFNAPGPIMAIYFISVCENKYEYTATMNLAFFPSAVAASLTHYAYGNISPELIKLSLINLIAISLGVLLGLIAFKKLKKSTVEVGLNLMLIVMGSTLIMLP